MSLDQSIQILFETHGGERYPRLIVKADGCHDVGRLLAALAHGNCEQAHVARAAARELNRTEPGRATLAYLHRQGGPDLTPPKCEPCAAGDCDGCWSVLSPYGEDECGCYDAAEDRHMNPVAIARATGMDA